MPSAIVNTAIHNAQNLAVRNSIFNIKNNLANNRWLNSNNRYSTDVIEILKNDITATTVNTNDLQEYIVASAFLHFIDGWEYLSKSVVCLINGDIYTSIHLSYYAELRASMSFMATEGIGVFRDKHIWFDANNDYKVIPLATHTVVRELLDGWSLEPSKSERLLQIIRINTHTLKDWLIAAGFQAGSPVLSLLAETWLKNWSIDLKMINDDHLARNNASYRPHNVISTNSNFTWIECIKQLLNIWEVLEPSGSTGFEWLDYYLLRRSLRFAYLRGQGGKFKDQNFIRYVDNAFNQLGVQSQVLREYILSNTHKPHFIFVAAKKDSLKNGDLYPLGVVARAILMLRLASGAVNDLLNFGGINNQDLKLWRDVFGEASGLWDTNHIPGDVFDLWVDIKEANRDILDWCASNNNSKGSYLATKATNGIPSQLWQVQQFNLAGLWSLGL